jgi:hypothetical protein
MATLGADSRADRRASGAAGAIALRSLVALRSAVTLTAGLVYRLVAFCLQMLASAVVLLELRRPRREI